MYGFMVTNTNESDNQGTQTNVTEVQVRIKRALLWLRNNNDLFEKFDANYDTLYRYDPDKVLHLHAATEYATDYKQDSSITS